MARARNIKPGFFKNEKLGDMDPLARLLFAGLWCLADREGRLEDRPRRIQIETLPYDDCDVDQILQVLHDARLIQRYTVNGSRFIQILKWRKHQNPHHKEVDSEIPPLEQEDTQAQAKHESSMNQEQVKEIASCPTDSLNSDSLNPSISTEPSALVLERIPLNDKSEYPITDTHVAEFERLYPAVDVRQALREMRGWCLTNPTKRKTKRGVLKFVNSWLSREQDKGGKHATHQREDSQSLGKRLRAESGS